MQWRLAEKKPLEGSKYSDCAESVERDYLLRHPCHLEEFELEP
jgi:hypothetical protein